MTASRAQLIRLIIVAVIATTAVISAAVNLNTGHAEMQASERVDRVCMNRCEAKGWSPGCYEKCLKQWR